MRTREHLDFGKEVIKIILFLAFRESSLTRCSGNSNYSLNPTLREKSVESVGEKNEQFPESVRASEALRMDVSLVVSGSGLVSAAR